MSLQPDQVRKSRKSSYMEDDLGDTDKFEIDLPTELIPDEYQHINNENGLVHIFRKEKKSDSENTTRLCDSFERLGYNIPEGNVHFIKTKKKVLLDIRRISEKDQTGKTCLIVIFLGEIKKDDCFTTSDGEVISSQEIWSPFINCSSLKHTPKIFIFQACKVEEKVSADSLMTVEFQGFKPEHDIPTEADVLIIYKKIEGTQDKRLSFIVDLCEQIDKYGRRDDLGGLITRINHNDNQPLIISTLTKKFYLSSSIHRDYYYDLKEMNQNIIDKIDQMEEKMMKLEKLELRKLKKKSPFRITHKGNNTETDSAVTDVPQKNKVAADSIVKPHSHPLSKSVKTTKINKHWIP